MTSHRRLRHQCCRLLQHRRRPQTVKQYGTTLNPWIWNRQKTIPSPRKTAQSPRKTLQNPRKTVQDSPKKNWVAISGQSPRKSLPGSPRRTLQHDLKDTPISSPRSPRKLIVYAKSTVVAAKSPGKNKLKETTKEELMLKPDLKNKLDIIKSSPRKLSKKLLNENDEGIEQNKIKCDEGSKICPPLQSPNKNPNKVVNKECEKEATAMLQSPRKKHLPSDMRSQPWEGEDIYG